jgi:hypothetical protein
MYTANNATLLNDKPIYSGRKIIEDAIEVKNFWNQGQIFFVQYALIATIMVC